MMYSKQLQGQLYSHSRKEKEADAASYYDRGVHLEDEISGAQHNKEQHMGDPQQYSNIRHSNGRIIKGTKIRLGLVSLLCTYQMQGGGLVVVSSVMDGIFCDAHQKFTLL